MERSLEGKVAVVTGSGRGIGLGIAKKLCEKGAAIVISDVNEANAQAGAASIEAMGGQAIYTLADVSKFEDAQNLIDAAIRRMGKVDILVSNAGINKDMMLHKMTADAWNAVIGVNLTGVFNCMRAVINHMREREYGRIINISSMWGTSGASCEAAYSASKSGVNGLTRALAKELAPSNIQVNAIACGVIDTEMNRQLSAEERKELEDAIPAGRYGTPDEIARIVWDTANAPEYMTGQIIGVDGGYL